MEQPLPTLFDWNRPFFEAGLTGKLMLQKCDQCGDLIYYPRICCPKCLSNQYHWEGLSGRGTVYSFAVVWRPQHPAFESQIPITLATIELAEGPQMVSTVIGCPPERVEIGMKVQVNFEKVAEGIALPKFVPMSR